MMLRFVCSFLLFSLLSWPLCAQDFVDVQEYDEQGVDITQHLVGQEALLGVLRQTYLHNPKIKAARADLRARYELLPQARSGYLPSVSVGGDYTNTDIDGSLALENSATKTLEASVTQPLFRGGRTWAAVDSADSQIQSALYGLYSIEQSVLLDTITAYLDVVRDQSLLELSENNLKVIQTQYDATQDRFEVGEVTRTDVSQALSRLRNAEADLIASKGNLNSSKAVFRRLTGQDAARLVYPTLANFNEPDSLDAALEIAQKNNPDLLSAKQAYDASESTVDEVWGELLPEVNLEGYWGRKYEHGEAEITTQQVVVSASMPLYNGGATRSRVRQAKENSNNLYMSILDTQRQVEQETISAWENLKAARAEITSRVAQVESAALAREGVRAEAEFGERTVLDVLDSDQEYLDAQVSLVTTKRNVLVGLFTLFKQMGKLNPEFLGFMGDGVDYLGELADTEGKVFSMSVPNEERE